MGDVIGLGLGAKRIRQSESHFGMFDPLGVKSQLLSSVAFLLIILQATPTASSLISGETRPFYLLQSMLLGQISVGQLDSH